MEAPVMAKWGSENKVALNVTQVAANTSWGTDCVAWGRLLNPSEPRFLCIKKWWQALQDHDDN